MWAPVRTYIVVTAPQAQLIETAKDRSVSTEAPFKEGPKKKLPDPRSKIRILWEKVISVIIHVDDYTKGTNPPPAFILVAMYTTTPKLPPWLFGNF